MDQQVVDISPPFSACSQDTGATWPVVDPCQGGPSVQPGAAGLAHTHFLGEQQMHPGTISPSSDLCAGGCKTPSPVTS